jgi:DNA-directed RNA polymerase specialized sigma24 family protein
VNTLAPLVALKGMSASAPPAAPAPSLAVSAEDLVARHLTAVWRYLRMHGASAHEADDLAQDAFVIALRKGAAALDPAATATFLRRTARFLFLRARRDRRGAVDLADAVDALWSRDCEQDDGDGLVASLRTCVGELQGRARDAIRLCYGVGADDAAGRDAACRALGLQPNGLKTLLQRTRQLLRACLERSKP